MNTGGNRQEKQPDSARLSAVAEAPEGFKNMQPEAFSAQENKWSSAGAGVKCRKIAIFRFSVIFCGRVPIFQGASFQPNFKFLPLEKFHLFNFYQYETIDQYSDFQHFFNGGPFCWRTKFCLHAGKTDAR